MKKILTTLALMIATVAVVATGYTLTRPAKTVGTPVNYTDNAQSDFSGSTIDLGERTVTVTETSDGVYTFVVPNVKAGSNDIADFTVEGVKGSLNDDGSVSYSFSGSATTTNPGATAWMFGITSGGTNAVTLTGKSYGEKLYFELGYTLTQGTPKFIFGSEITVPTEPTTTVEGTVVGTDGYAPAGSAFTWTTDIDWNTQKLVVAIDVSKCSTFNGNILSVGSQIDTWDKGAHFHFYYVPETKALKSNFLTNGQNVCRVKESGIVLDSDELLIEISKKTGLTVNGVDFNYYYGGTEQFTDFETVYANLWALTNIQVGSQEGSNRSDATYKYVRVQNLDNEPAAAEPVVYKDKAKSNFFDIDYNVDEQTVEITETAENTYKVVLKDFTLSSRICDLTAEGVKGETDSEGNTVYSYTGTATASNVAENYTSDVTEGGTLPFTMTGSSKDGQLTATFTTSIWGNTATVTFGETKEPEPQNVVEINPSTGTLSSYNNSTNWLSHWTSTQADPQIELSITEVNGTTEVNNISNANSTGTTIQAWRGAKDSDYKLSISDGWVITGYSFDVTLAAAGTSIQLTANDKTITPTTETQNVKVEGLNASSVVAFTLTGNNVGVNITNWKVTYAAAAPTYPTYNFSGQSLAWNGTPTATGKGSNETDVVITDKGEGLYDINIKKLTCYGDYEVTFANVPGAAKGEGIEFSTNGETLDGSVSGPSSGTAKMTVVGKMLGEQLYIFCSGKFLNWSDDPFTITVGTDFDLVKPVTYTDKATTTFSGNYETTFENSEVNVYDNGDGTYKFVIKQFAFSEYNYVMGDLSAEGVTSTTNEDDGSISYEFSGKAKVSNVGASASGFGFADGGEVDLAFEGKSKEGKLYVNGTIVNGDYTFTYVFGESLDPTPDPQPVVPGTVVGEDSYAPAGSAFTWTTDIDWNTQKLVAAIDVTGCTGSYENILSVGYPISSWNGANFHLYYTRSSKTLQVNYCNAGGNPIRMQKTVDADELLVEITKAGGITVNGEAWNYTNDNSYSGDLTEDMSVYSDLWNLTSIQVGSQEGSTRSNATYKYVRVQEVPVTITATETFYDDMSVTEPSTKVKTTENAQLDINTYSDGTYGVTIYGVAGEEATLGDITVKGVGVTEEDGVTYYNAEASVTLNEEEWTATVTGVKYADGKVWFQVELMNANENIYYIAVGHEQTVTGINAINAAARDGKADIYTLNGVKVNAMQKGINIVRMNGKTVKIVKK